MLADRDLQMIALVQTTISQAAGCWSGQHLWEGVRLSHEVTCLLVEHLDRPSSSEAAQGAEKEDAPMPGPAAAASEIREALRDLYGQLSSILENQPPLPILDLVRRDDLQRGVQARLTEREWRLLRFAVERAIDSV
jgi:hypothetical protein